MRYTASEKREIIDLVECSSLPVRRTLDRLGIPKSTFYGWYERYRTGGDIALADRRPGGGQTWNRLPETIRRSVFNLALERPELSARELAVLYTEQQRYFVSESGVYRLLKAHDLITSPAFVLLKARIGAFVDYYNTERYHESLNNLTPEGVYTGRGQTVLNRRRQIKQKTLAERRRLYYQEKAA